LNILQNKAQTPIKPRVIWGVAIGPSPDDHGILADVRGPELETPSGGEGEDGLREDLQHAAWFPKKTTNNNENIEKTYKVGTKPRFLI